MYKTYEMPLTKYKKAHTDFRAQYITHEYIIERLRRKYTNNIIKTPASNTGPK